MENQLIRFALIGIALGLLAAAGTARAQNALVMSNISVSGRQDNWATFPLTSETFPAEISIDMIKGSIVGADGLTGEFALWLTVDDPVNGIIFPPGATVKRRILYSFGTELYTDPSNAVIDTAKFSPDYLDVPANTPVSIVINAGPVNLPGGGQSAPVSYVGAVNFWYH